MPNKFNQFIHRQFRKNETALHELNYLFWECTRRCNIKCLHCGSDCSAEAAAEDMPFDDFLRAILPLQKVSARNSITIAITGGEPLMRKDLARCGRALRENGFLWGIVTNGYAYTQEVHAKLLAAGMGAITVSLDGLEPTHNWLRGNSGSFVRAVNALKMIRSVPGLAYDVVTCVNPRNINELPALKEFLIAEQIKAWRLCTIAPIGRAAENGDLRLSPAEVKQLMDFIVDARKDTRMATQFSCESHTGQYEQKVRDSCFFCHAGVNIASVLQDGSISACPNINRHFVQGNIYQDNFLDVWENRFDVMRNRNWTKTGPCRECSDYKDCLGGAMHLWKENQDANQGCIRHRLSTVTA
ncbi:radical SAM/SPASM domain-containing protein [Spirochaetia bacterium]|nr:radical SAM/SPASM domain-containing protein [Spirochaetia bacterium]